MLTEVLENQAKESPPPHLSEALRSWLRLGCISFGGTAVESYERMIQLVDLAEDGLFEG